MNENSRNQIIVTGPLAIFVSLWALYKLGLFKNIDLTKYLFISLVIIFVLALLFLAYLFVDYLIKEKVQNLASELNDWSKQFNFEHKEEFKSLRSEQIKREEKVINAIRELNLKLQELSKSPEEVSKNAIEQFL